MFTFRVRVQFVDGRTDGVVEAESFGEADYLADEIRAGKFWAAEEVARVRVQIECPTHGWADGSSGYCELCYDAETEAEMERYYFSRLDL